MKNTVVVGGNGSWKKNKNLSARENIKGGGGYDRRNAQNISMNNFQRVVNLPEAFMN